MFESSGSELVLIENTIRVNVEKSSRQSVHRLLFKIEEYVHIVTLYDIYIEPKSVHKTLTCSYLRINGEKKWNINWRIQNNQARTWLLCFQIKSY